MRKRLTIAIGVMALSLAAVNIAGAAKPVKPPAPTAHNPIVFVHGYTGSGSNWNTMISRLKADGWTAAELPTPLTYSSSTSNKNNAEAIKQRVDQVLASTGAAKVDIVTHSMGGLSSRWFVKYLGGDAKVDDWVSLGGPNHGSTWANGCATIPCLEMRPTSSFIADLNAGDETPGAVNYGTWRSPCDELVTPSSSTELSGARNTTTACIGHVALLTDVTTYQQVREFVR